MPLKLKWKLIISERKHSSTSNYGLGHKRLREKTKEVKEFMNVYALKRGIPAFTKDQMQYLHFPDICIMLLTSLRTQNSLSPRRSPWLITKGCPLGGEVLKPGTLSHSLTHLPPTLQTQSCTNSTILIKCSTK